MTDAAIQALIDAAKTGDGDLVTWAELKAILEGMKGQGSLEDLGTPVTGKIAKVVGGAWAQADEAGGGGGLTVTGTPSVGKIPKVQPDGTTVSWDDDMGVAPGTFGGTLNEVLIAGNTTSRNIAFDKTITTPVSNGQGDGHTWFSIAPLAKTGVTGAGAPSTFYWNHSSLFQDNSVNEVMHFGWNIAPGGGSVNTAIPGIGESWESNYKPFTNRYVEKHEFYITPSSFTLAPASQIRLSSYTIDSITGGIDYYHTVSRHYYKRPYTADAESVYFLVQPGGLNGAVLSLAATDTKNLTIGYDYTAGVTVSGNGMDTGFKRIIFQNFEQVVFANAGLTLSGSPGGYNFSIAAGTAVFDPVTADAVDIGVENRNFRAGYFKQLGWRTKAGNPSVSDVPNGTWQIWENTSTGEFKIWLNKTGTLKSSAALT